MSANNLFILFFFPSCSFGYFNMLRTLIAKVNAFQFHFFNLLWLFALQGIYDA